jgi:hypothetical protein
MEADMPSFLQIILVLCLLLTSSGAAATAGEPNISGLWRGTIYGSDLQAEVEQDGQQLLGVVVIHALSGETNLYHVIGTISNGHLRMLHGSGHVFEGEATADTISGVLTTKGGSKVELRATKVPPSSNGQGAPGANPAETPRQPG